MEKNTFMGQYSGFLKIGAEEVEKDPELISYSARPYSGSEKVENCISFDEDDFLIIRDVRSPADSEYDCIWDREDIESAMDRIGKERRFYIQKISCSNITKLTLPSACEGFEDSAFDGCKNLEILNCFCDAEELPNISVYSVYEHINEDPEEDLTSENIDSEFVNEIKSGAADFKRATTFLANTPVITPNLVTCYYHETVYDRFIVSISTKEIHTGSILFGKWVFIPLKDMLIEKNGIAKDVPIFAVSGGSIEEYAKKNGNPFTALDGEIPKSCIPYTVKGKNIVFRKKIDLVISGLTKGQEEELNGKKLIAVAGSENNPLRIGFEAADTHEFAGVLKTLHTALASFNMKNGYLKLENCIFSEPGIVTCDLVFLEPHSEACDRWFYILSLIDIDENNIKALKSVLQNSEDLDIEFCAYEQINKIPDSIEEDPDFGAYVILDSAE